ncbi:MAG: imidazolonepropionase [Planctomycetota bacterium]
MTSETRAIDLLVTNAAFVVTPEGTRARGGQDLRRVRSIAGGSVAVRDGTIVAVGTELERADGAIQRGPKTRVLDAGGGVVVPGFVDCHTHPVFLGTRETEFELRTRGASYVEIAAAGGGILSSVEGVRGADAATLGALLALRLDRFLDAGTTTIEAKSGYGLSLDAERKSLEVLRAAGSHPVEIVPTFLGAHDVPPEYRDDRGAYVDLLIDAMLPAIREAGLAEYADIFTEDHVFGLVDSRRILERARELGFGLRMHVDQLSPLGGAELAAELGATSADHLEFVSDRGIDALGEAGVVPVLCPVVPLYLRVDQEAPARRMIDRGLAPALSTDFNPGSCYLQSLAEVASWAALRYRMTAEECLTAITLNAAASLGRADRLGSLEVGKQADLVVLDVPNLAHLVYELGRNPVRAVVKRGEVVRG